MYKVFQKEIQKHGGVLLNYPFNSPLKVGDYGTMDKNGQFSRRGNIIEDDTELKIITRENTDSLRITSGEGVAVDLVQQVESAIVNIDLTVKFNRENSIFVNLGAQTVTEFDNIDRLADYIQRRINADMWDLEAVIVTTVFSTKNVILAGSSSSNAKIRFGTKLAEEVKDEVLKKAEVKWSVGAHNDTGFHYSSETEVNILFKAHQMVKRFLSRKTVMVPVVGNYMGTENNQSEYRLAEFSIN